MTSNQSVFDFNLPAAMGGQDFIISNSNREAVEWLGNASNWPVPALVIYGAPSSGKSHLCQIWQEIHYATAITIDLLQDEMKMAGTLKPNGFYFVDDVDQIISAGKPLQSALFHLYNFLFNEGGRVLMTSPQAPKDLTIDIADLSSRLLAALAVEIKDPDDQTLQALLLKLFDDRQILIKPEVVKFLLPRIERSYEAIRATVEGLDSLSLQGKRPITVPLVRQWLEQRDQAQQKSLFS